MSLSSVPAGIEAIGLSFAGDWGAGLEQDSSTSLLSALSLFAHHRGWVGGGQPGSVSLEPARKYPNRALFWLNIEIALHW